MRDLDHDAAMRDDTDKSDDFSLQDAMAIQTLTLLRVYDLLGAILTHMEPELATEVLKKHNQGEFIAPPPWGADDV